ncbi:MAG: ABC transporter permease [candidate division Zixibacteria bacterium]|nr:ABC transporter permease [candidate division Zixibacteria bacterium]
MIRHMFKLIWNRKRRNYLLISEIFFSFVVLFAVSTFALFTGIRLSEPLGFDYEDVLVVQTNYEDAQQTDSLSEREVKDIMATMERELRSCREVVDVAWGSSNLPWAGSMWRTSYIYDGIERDYSIHYVSDHFADVMTMPLLEGRWFNADDDAAAITPIVINRKVCETTFGDKPAIGQIITDDDDETPVDFVVIGVVDEYRYRGEMEVSEPSIFFRRTHEDSLTLYAGTALVKVRPDAGVGFQKTITDRLAEISHGWIIGVEALEDARNESLRNIKINALPGVIVALFLVFNVALGLFGILWYSVSRRRGEIGVRRAAGALAAHISWQIIGEALVMATFAILVGIILAIQVPLLDIQPQISTAIYLLAMICSSLMIYMIVAVCAMYPSRLAARIQPAEALHDE